MKSVRAPWAALVLLPGLLLAGCGSAKSPAAGQHVTASSSPSATTAPPTAAGATTPSTPLVTPSATEAPLVVVHGNGFTMGLPHKPKVSAEDYDTEVGKVHAVLYTDSGKNDAFVAALTAYPKKHQITLDGAIDGIVKTVGGTLRLARKITFHGMPARQARIVGTSGTTPVTVFVLVIDVHSKLFQLEYIVSGPELTTAPPILTRVAYSIKFD